MTRGPLILAGVLIGAGLGGLLDGILMRWGAYLCLFTWVITVAGIVVLWIAAKRVDVPWSGRSCWGALLLGWGGFNFLEGLIGHNLLGMHYVVERLGLSMWDYLFLASGVVLMVLGVALLEIGRRRQLNELAQSPPVSE